MRQAGPRHQQVRRIRVIDRRQDAPLCQERFRLSRSQTARRPNHLGDAGSLGNGRPRKLQDRVMAASDEP